jgi:hypothetical protein
MFFATFNPGWVTLHRAYRRTREGWARSQIRDGGHEQLISNSGRFKSAFVERYKKQTMIDIRGISTNWFKKDPLGFLGLRSHVTARKPGPLYIIQYSLLCCSDPTFVSTMEVPGNTSALNLTGTTSSTASLTNFLQKNLVYHSFYSRKYTSYVDET